MPIKYTLKAKRVSKLFLLFIQVTVDGQTQTVKAAIYIFIFKKVSQDSLKSFFFLNLQKNNQIKFEQ